MANDYNLQRDMLSRVAKALGQKLRAQSAFLGGCTTGLFLTDDLAKEEVRFTEDVDLVIDLMGYAAWADLQEQLRSNGFQEYAQDDIICRMRLGDLKVDFMPKDATILGFTNRWYDAGLKTAQDYTLDEGLTIRLLTPELFVATKLEAWLGRGKNDPLSSHDIEDILIVLDGREQIVSEIKNADTDVRNYITNEFKTLSEHAYYEYTIHGNFRSNRARANYVLERIEAIKSL